MTTTASVARVNGQLASDWLHTDGKAHARLADSWDDIEGVTKFAALVWDTVGLDWVRMIQPGGGTGGGGAVTVADGADVTQGAKADAAWDGVVASPTIVAIDKAMWAKLEAVRALLAAPLAVTGSVTVSGSVTANIGTSGSLALDATVSAVAKDGTAITGQALEAGGASNNGWLSSVRKAITDRLGALGQAVMASSTPVAIASDQSAVASKNAAASQVDGHSAAIGATTDAATATTVIGRLQKLVALLAGGLPAALGRTTMAGSLSVAIASDQATVQVQQQSSTLIVSGQGTANAAFTTTLPAAGAGLFHYITAIEIIRSNPTATAVAGSAVNLAITTTNLPGALGWHIGNALAAGAYDVVIRLMLNSPIKSSVANTATTIVCPAGGAGIQFQVNVYYYTGT